MTSKTNLLHNHGDYGVRAVLAQKLKDTMKATPNWSKLTDDQKESLEGIAGRIASMLCGDPEYQKHWFALGNYAKLSMDMLGEPEATGETGRRDVASGDSGTDDTGTGWMEPVSFYRTSLTIPSAITNQMIETVLKASAGMTEQERVTELKALVTFSAALEDRPGETDRRSIAPAFGRRSMAPTIPATSVPERHGVRTNTPPGAIDRRDGAADTPVPPLTLPDGWDA